MRSRQLRSDAEASEFLPLDLVMENEAQDVLKMGIEIIVGSVLMFILVGFVYTAHRAYADEEYRKYQTQYMSETSPDQTFVRKAAQGGSVSGDEIVNFIVRNDSRYEYVIGTGEFADNGRKLTDQNLENIGTNRNNYTALKRYAFSDRDVLQKLDVDLDKNNYQDKTDERGVNTGVRVINPDLSSRRLEYATQILHTRKYTPSVYSENYLLYTIGFSTRLENNFRVYMDRQNGDIIRWYFLMDPQITANPDKGGR